jgi:hypothetical protein
MTTPQSLARLAGQHLTKYEAQNPLSEPRRLELGEVLARAVGEQERLEIHLKDFVQRTKDAIKIQRQRVSETASTLNQGFEMVKLACSQTLDFDRNTMQIRRLDTGAIVEERALTAEEREEAMQAAPKKVTRAVPRVLDKAARSE